MMHVMRCPRRIQLQGTQLGRSRLAQDERLGYRVRCRGQVVTEASRTGGDLPSLAATPDSVWSRQLKACWALWRQDH